MTVKRIVSREERVRIWGPGAYEADEWIIDEDESGTPLNLHRRLAPAVSRQVRFVSPKSGPRSLFFISETRIYAQATRGVQELTRESAELLDRIIEITDSLPRSGDVVTVTEEMLANAGRQPPRLPEEVPSGSVYKEGSVQSILINRYERDFRARADCIRHYGTTCVLCGSDFAAVYWEVMTGFTHVHHCTPLSSLGAGYEVDPIRDLRPVCPNCHAVLHRREPAYSLEEVQRFLRDRRGTLPDDRSPATEK